MNLREVIAPVTSKLSEWSEAAIKMVPNVLVAVFCLLIFWLLAILTGWLVRRMVLRLSVYRHVAELTSQLSRLVVILIGSLLALYALHLNNIVASTLAGIGIVSLALGLAAKDTGGDYLAGFIIHFTHPYRVGHLIEAGKFMGYVTSIDLRATTIHTQQGQKVIIPNHKIIGNELTNYYATGERRVDIKCGIAQNADLEKAEDVAVKAVKSLKTRNSERDVELFYEGIGDFTIDFTLRFWADPDQKSYLTARSQAIKAITQAFHEHGIVMPSPIRTLEFSTATGGSLREQLQEIERSSAAQKAKPEQKKTERAQKEKESA
jgi:small conductance mechanosensitive channel